MAHAVDAVPASDLMDEAADEIDRLRLTDVEREAVERAIAEFAHHADRCREDGSRAATLRGLLSRLAPLSGVGQSQDSGK